MDRETLLKNVSQINGIQGAMLLNKEGLTLSSSLPDEVDHNLISAVLSSVFSNIDIQSKRMQRGQLKKFIIETETETLSVLETEIDGNNLLVFSQFGTNLEIEDINNHLEKVIRG